MLGSRRAKQAAETAAQQKDLDTLQAAQMAAETALVKSVHDAYVTATQSSMDRALTRANVVTASAGAIATTYTGLLALVFAAEPGKGRPLSVVALVPALFLGLSLLLVVIYVAGFRKKYRRMDGFLAAGIGGSLDERRLKLFMDWSFRGIWARSWALRTGIVSLGIGVMSLPLPFVIPAPQVGDDGAVGSVSFWVALAVVVAGALLLVTYGIVAQRSDEKENKEAPPGPPDPVD